MRTVAELKDLRAYYITNAYGVYMGGKKSGWVIEEMKLGKHAGKDVLRVASETYLATAFDDVVWFPATVEEVVQPVTASARQIRSAALARHCWNAHHADKISTR